MSNKPRFFGLALLCLSVATGCVSNKSVKGSRVAGKAATVVPVSGQPVLVISENLGLVAVGTVAAGLPGAILASSANQNATGKARRTLTDRLNEDLRDFKPEVILAEECAKLLNTSTRKRRFASVTLRSDPIPLPGREELVRHETQPFKSTTSHRFDWHTKIVDWMKRPPVHGSTASSPQGQDGINVEATFALLDVINGKKLDPAIVIRVIDPAKGEIIGSQYVAARYKLRPLTPTSDLNWFVEDVRRSINELTRKALKDLKLL